MGGMGGVLHDTGSFTGASCKENVQDGGERGTDDVHHNLLCLTRIEGQVVCTTPFNYLCHFHSVGCFIIVADEAYHSCVIGKLDDVVGAELGNAIVSQRREEQRAEHTAQRGTCAQCGSARGVVADTD